MEEGKLKRKKISAETTVEILFFLFLLVFYLMWARVQPMGAGPDEQMRYQIADYIYVHHAGGDESQDNGPGDAAEEPFPRLLGRKAFAQAVSADGHAHQIGENVVGPDDENVENHHPGTPRLAADDRNVTHQRERQRHVDDAHESDADIGGGILPTAVKFADEHGGQQQQQKGHSAGESLPGAAEYLDVVRHECEIQGEKHESRSQSDDPLGIAALLLGQGIELRHADDQQRRQQQVKNYYD